MSARAHLSKLSELRAKTDRELVEIIDNALEVGLSLAATSTRGDTTGRLHGRAQEIYANTLILLPKVADVSKRRRLEERLKQLQEGLEPRSKAMSFSA